MMLSRRVRPSSAKLRISSADAPSMDASAPAGGVRASATAGSNSRATGSIALLIFGLSQGQQHGFTNAATLTALALAVLLGMTFVIFQERAETPMLPRQVLPDPARRAALVAMLLFGTVVAGYFYFTSLYNQDVLHFAIHMRTRAAPKVTA